MEWVGPWINFKSGWGPMQVMFTIQTITSNEWKLKNVSEVPGSPKDQDAREMRKWEGKPVYERRKNERFK